MATNQGNVNASESKGSAMSLIRHAPFLFFFWVSALSEFSYQIGAVALGWQVYALTSSAFDLGLVGLIQFIPSALLTFAAGHVADRYPRQRVVQVCVIVQGLTAVFMAWGSFAGWINIVQIFAAAAVFGAATAFESGATAALLGTVPAVLLGGLGTVVVALLWMRLFPTLLNVEKLEGG
jgi:MFS family permease